MSLHLTPDPAKALWVFIGLVFLPNSLLLDWGYQLGVNCYAPKHGRLARCCCLCCCQHLSDNHCHTHTATATACGGTRRTCPQQGQWPVIMCHDGRPLSQLSLATLPESHGRLADNQTPAASSFRTKTGWLTSIITHWHPCSTACMHPHFRTKVTHIERR